MANPTKYTPELAEKIYEHLLDGKGLNAIAKLPGMPSRPTMLDWTNKHPEFDKIYSDGLAAQTEGRMGNVRALNAKMVKAAETIDDPRRANVMVHAIQNQIQNEFRMAACLQRKRYGDKVDLNHSGAVGVTLLNDIPRPNRD